MSQFETPAVAISTLRAQMEYVLSRLNKISTADGKIRQDGAGTLVVGVPEIHGHLGTGQGGVLASGTGFLHKLTSSYEHIKSNLGATTDPGVSDDDTAGYAVGSRWINVTLDKEFICLDASTGTAVWTETTGAGGGGGGPHNILDAADDHSDVATFAVAEGAMLRANVTPAWDGLSLSIPVADVRNVLGVDNGETTFTWKTALDATDPANIAAAATPGTSLIFSHRDHVHAHPDLGDLHTVYFLADGTRAMTGDIDLDGNNLADGGVIFLREQVAADADIVGQGQFWVLTATPNTPQFTDDVGNDRALIWSGGDFHDGFSDFVADEHLLVGAIDHDLLLNFLVAEHFTEASIDHGSIVGLADDDHTQYLLAAGTRALTGNWNPGVFDIGNHDYTSRVELLSIDDVNFFLDIVGVLPRITFDATDYIEYNRTANQFKFVIGAADEMVLAANALGIGTSTPDERVHIAKAVDGISVGLLIENSQANTAGSTNEIVELRFGFGGNNDVARIAATKIEDFTVPANETSALSFYTRFNGTIAQSARLRAGGVLEIFEGTTQIQFRHNIPGGSSPSGPGILYLDSGSVVRNALMFPGSDLVVLSNRASNGVVEIRANAATAGSGGEVVVAQFEDDLLTLLSGINLHLVLGYEDITQIAVPANPAAGTRRLFTDSATGELSVRTTGSATVSLEAGGLTDHGALTGLGDDDHTQYALLAGRTGGQVLIGSTLGGEDLDLRSTSSVTKGDILFGTNALIPTDEPALQFNQSPTVDWTPGVSDHGIGSIGIELVIQSVFSMNFTIDPANALSTAFNWRHGAAGAGGTLMMTLGETGLLRLPLSGIGGGLQFGSDVQLYREAINLLTLRAGDNFHIDSGYIDIDQIGVPANPAAGTRRLFTDSATGELSVRTNAGGTISLEGGGGTNSVITYVFVPDAAFDADIATGDAQGVHHHSGDAIETVIAWIIDFETTPTGATIIIQLEYADTDDLDTASVWTEIDREALPISAKTIRFTGSFTNGTIPANRLIRMNIDQIGSTVKGQNGAVHLFVKRPLV